jgi:hypothetical protein
MILRKRSPVRRAAGVVGAIAVMCGAAVAIAGAGTSTNHYLGSMSGVALNRPIVAMASTRTGHGYWLAASDGGVFTFGDARFHGSMGKRALAAPIVGIAATRSGHGYWLGASDGGVFTFGDAHFYGSAGHRPLAAPVVGIAATRTGRGYWLATANGRVFTYGDARTFSVSLKHPLTAPIVGIAATRTGRGYWLAAANGRVYTHGDARFYGSARPQSLTAPVTGITVTHDGRGYWLVSTDGSTHAFGHARAFRAAFPSAPDTTSWGRNAIVTIAASPKGGFWVASRNGTVGVSANRTPTAGRAPTPSLISLQLVIRMNAERSARHLAPLTWNPLLAARASAWAHTLLTSDQFRHQNLGTIAAAANGRFSEVGENLYSGTGSAADAGTAHLALMGSLEHRENMLLPQGQLVGIGAACSAGKLMVVEDFAIGMGAPLPPPAQPVPPVSPIVATNADGAHC